MPDPEQPRAAVAASAYAWFVQELTAAAPHLLDGWWRGPEELFSGPPELIYNDRWPHDHWIAHGVRHAGHGRAVQTWQHRGAIDDWPVLHAPTCQAALSGWPVTGTAAAAFDRNLAAAPASRPRRADAVAAHAELRARAAQDTPMQLMTEIVLAWVDSTLGRALGAIARGTGQDPGHLHAETGRRLAATWLTAQHGWEPKLNLQMATELLFTAAWPRWLPTRVRTQQGQPHETRDSWHWLGRDLDQHGLRTSLALGAADAGDAGGDRERRGRRGAARHRRAAALGLRVLTWLEQALDHPWADVRQVDVVAFAFAAIAPSWPRPTLAVSHRSGEAKPELVRSAAWGSAHVAIDAATVPSWESNTGLVWRLFAATPSTCGCARPVIRTRRGAVGSTR